MHRIVAAVLGFLLLSQAAIADPAVIEQVVSTDRGGTWRFDVTIRHGDTGWDDYADGWRVELADGTVLDTRVLFHPHVEEQPFTRSLQGVVVPADVSEVFIRARTNVDGWDDSTTPHRVRD